MAARESDRPRIRVAAVILINDRLVLVRQSKGGSAPYYLLPGGGVEHGETLAAALVREVREETGLICTPGPMLFVNDSIAPTGRRHAVNITFLATVPPDAIPHATDDPSIQAILLADVSRLGSYDIHPPYTLQLQQAIASGFAGPASYLGSLWTAQ